MSGAVVSSPFTETKWVDALVDCPGAQELFTYVIPAGLSVQPGDILSVPFGSQHVGAIAVRCYHEPPTQLEPTQVREIDTVISAGFFPSTYWTLLNRIAEYYYTPLIQVVRVALPPGLLARSQRRIRLLTPSSDPIPAANSSPSGLSSLSPIAQHLLQLLQSSKSGDYSWVYLHRQVKGASRGLKELAQSGWIENYLEPPEPVRPKRRQAVILVEVDQASSLTSRQQEVLSVLKRQGGELWLTDLLQLCQTSSSTLKALERQGCLIIQAREVLRAETAAAIVPDTPKALTAEQTQALTQIQSVSGFTQILLHGVTGSGKTEVYLQAIAPILQQGGSALVLVPEIGLTPQLTDRFRARFGHQVCVYHSALSEGERYDTWRQMFNGQAQVVIGTRSAIFAPLSRLGLIILDEEHDSSFKQDQPPPCYHARTIAQWRAELEQCPLILGSATPSSDSWVTVRGDEENRGDEEDQGDRGENQLSSPSSPPSLYLSLPTRVHARSLPAVEIVDMRQELHQGNRSIFSRSLQFALQTLKEQGQQGILFIHRRGHSTFVSCRSCGYVVTCPNCDVSLAYHHTHSEAQPFLRCHYCNYGRSHPNTCPSCDSLYLKHFGSGTQRVIQDLAEHFPELRTIRFDSDTTRTKGSHRALLTRFAQGEAELLVGTQMLTKGLDLPQVGLVGILAADGLLHMSDYRASERTFQTLTQVAGRCGRGETPGRVILQTYSPEHPVIQSVKQHDYPAFIQPELQQRRSLHYPPYGRLILLRFSSENPIAVQTAAERVAQALATVQTPDMQLLGPAPATILRVARRYRWQILLKLPLDAEVKLPDITELRALCANGVSFLIDVDPLNVG
ncbi:MAG: primosomal protein N' [Pantanalinema sp. GBBB05]|nr:primosomal protein N' [Pantanalinema sp. GBBB05]